MEAVAPASDQAADLLQTMSLGSQTTTVEVPESIKKPSATKYGSGDGGDVASVPVPSGDRSTTPLLQEFIDPNMGYLPNGYTSYYYGGYDGPISDWDDYTRYVNSDGVEMPPAVYGDNGSLMYHHGYGYAPYGAYPPPGSPVPTMGHDGQLYGPQHYQYPAPYYQPQNPQSASNPGSTPQGDVSTSAATEQPALSVKISNGNTNGSVNVNNKGPSSLRPGYPNASVNSNGSAYGRGAFPAGVSPGYQNPGFGFDGMRSPVPWLDGPVFSDGKHRSVTSSSMSSTASHVNSTPLARNQNLHHVPHPMGLHTPRLTSGMVPAPGIMNRMYSNNRMYGNFGNPVRMGPGFGSNGYDSRSNGRGWLAVDNKYKPRGRGHGFFGYGNENSDGLNELNRGPRAGRLRTQKGLGPQITLAVKGQNLPINGNSDDTDAVTASDQYNREDFSVKYSEAKFFVIKSYSEDDIHKSIKYSMWASTPSGNKKLDGAFQEAQEKSGGCPVFLFFSVNTSGQFVGLAEMVGPVNFNKNLEYWQQDKWNGCFPVKWHIVKDVPNSLLKHITLENNDNKPVTNSRDTQEIKFDQGLQMLNIFKEHTSKVCILDDFTFYETRQKTLQERKSKQQQFQKQVWDGKHADRAGTNEKENNVFAKPKPEKPSESGQSLVDKNLPEDNVVVVPGGGDGDGQKGASTVVAIEKRVIANGVANS